MNNDENWSLIARYLARSVSAEEERALMAWAGEDRANQKKLDEATRVWNLTAKKLPMPAIETQQEWHALVKRIEDGEDTRRHASRFSYKRILAPLPMAAILLLAAFLVYILRDSGGESGREALPEKKSLAEVTAPQLYAISTADSVQQYYLPDSSRVWMNVNSELRFDSAFATREVVLAGEAFFEVKSRDAYPFTIAAGGATIRVTGTSFNVFARNEKPVEVVVVTGNVRLRGKDSTTLVLGPSDKGTYDMHDSSLLKSKNTDPAFLDWRKRNSSVLEAERKNPKQFLKNSYAYKKNVINETLIEGKLTNTSTLTAYKKIKLKISYTTSRGKKSEIFLDVATSKALQPGQTVDYRQKLFDVLSAKTTVEVVVHEAGVEN